MNVVDQIMAVMEAAFEPHWGEKWSRGQIADSLLIPGTDAIVIDGEGSDITDRQGTAAGFVLSRHAAGEEELLLIAVHPQHRRRSEEHTSELQSLMRISYAVFCLKKKKNNDDKAL